MAGDPGSKRSSVLIWENTPFVGGRSASRQLLRAPRSGKSKPPIASANRSRSIRCGIPPDTCATSSRPCGSMLPRDEKLRSGRDEPQIFETTDDTDSSDEETVAEPHPCNLCDLWFSRCHRRAARAGSLKPQMTQIAQMKKRARSPIRVICVICGFFIISVEAVRAGSVKIELPP